MLGRRFARSLIAASSVLATMLVAGCGGAASTEETGEAELGTVPRPTQYVILAFDGSLQQRVLG